jgi:hypothetical protein
MESKTDNYNWIKNQIGFLKPPKSSQVNYPPLEGFGGGFSAPNSPVVLAIFWHQQGISF